LVSKLPGLLLNDGHGLTPDELVGIYAALIQRRSKPIDLRQSVGAVLCLCGFLHSVPF
jgi:hypothetical protein